MGFRNHGRSGRDEAFRRADGLHSIALGNRRRLIIRDLTHGLSAVNGAARFGRKQARLYQCPESFITLGIAASV